ncbi:MAG: 4-alpha-glucanotransferase [Firmicutes bacterium]|nr:4-alpha-glucanotransferase [Bacillota bacterium]
MKHTRQCGILLHPTSLPSKYGIGDLGPGAYKFIDFLQSSGQKLWQILPLNPVGYGYSPYSSPSAFAGTPLIISNDVLIRDGLLTENDIEEVSQFDDKKASYDKVIPYKNQMFKKAYLNFKKMKISQSYLQFIEENAYWLEDYALFTALKYHYNDAPWNSWDENIAFRVGDNLKTYKKELQEEIEYQYFLQYQFFSQWQAVKEYANQKGIKIIGDLPIYVSHDSSDTWSHPELFELDNSGNPRVVAGVPPDYFSSTGQLWGNPIYNWHIMIKQDFIWWKKRIKNLLRLVDIIRVDHFRGFEAYWEIPADEETAVNGRWVKAPGSELFASIEKELNMMELPIIAEDLGIITPEVEELKDEFDLPGMKVLQFAFESGDYQEFAPEYHGYNSVVYTGTHDNNTIKGWYENIMLEGDLDIIKVINKYFHLQKENFVDENICWQFIETAYKSNAHTAIIPMQDILCLGSDARMNTPGTTEGNWQWRLTEDKLTSELEMKLRNLVKIYNR